jgi:hypothetical protein
MTAPDEDEKSAEHLSAGDVAEVIKGVTETAGNAADAVSRCDGCDGCDGCDACNACDGLGGCNLMRLSSLLFVAAFLVPDTGGGRLVEALLHGYRRWLTRFTPRCPSTPSCSAYAVTAVTSLGPRRGLTAAARRVRDCGRP